ncbi:MAG: VTT domain-containing protein [Bacteroidetes bacterium]|nr:VTT domain-containing protein [Bacteroidota bacterium]
MSSFPPARGGELIFLMILLATATLINEDLACIGAGLMAARGTLTLFTAFGAAFGGILLGDVLLYALGRGLGRGVVRRVPFRWFIRDPSLKRGSEWFKKRGFRVVFASRFVPGMRLPTYVAAGVMKAPFWTFLVYFFVASLIWAPIIVGVSTLLGNEILSFYSVYESFALVVLLGLVALIYASIHIFVPAFSHRGRRRLLSKWRRLSRWEFWHPFVFYPPLVLYVFWLAVRHRSLTVFTAANPGIPQGGFVGESKFAILSALKGGRHVVASFALVRPGEHGPAIVRDFMGGNGLDFPVVLKPDIGERGSDVMIARSEEDVRGYFDRIGRPTIIQEFAPGREYGVFYYRMPNEETGHIFSITDKRLLTVTGDGKRTLQDLILDDDRAVCMAPMHIGNHADRIDSVPAKGDRIELVSIGTHCLGALFLDGGSMITSELESTFDRISKTFEGFFFGRYDVRTTDIEEFRRGRGFKIVELNGVTSEATHIYDPSNSLFSAYRTLFRQWEIAFAIGAENARRGARPESVMNLIRLIYLNKLKRG